MLIFFLFQNFDYIKSSYQLFTSPALCFFLAFFLIFFGLICLFLNKSNLVLLLVFIEIILLGCGLLFIFGSYYRGAFEGYIFTLIIQTVAAGEAALALALLLLFYSNNLGVYFDFFKHNFKLFLK